MTAAENRALIAEIRAKRGVPPSSIEEERAGFAAAKAAIPLPEGVHFRPDRLGSRAALWALPAESDDGGGVILHLHGGAFCVGSPETARGLAGGLARAAGARAVALDYRLAPEHPYPAAMVDVMAAYRDLLDRGFAPARIAFAGDSAGGGLALAALAAIRDAALPAPAAAVLVSPWLDLTLAGSSMRENAGTDPILSYALLAEMAARYAPGRQAEASPLAVALDRLPPLLIQAGSTEVLRDDATRLAEGVAQAGGVADLRIWPEMVHVWHGHAHRLSEAREAIAEAGGWLAGHWPKEAIGDLRASR